MARDTSYNPTVSHKTDVVKSILKIIILRLSLNSLKYYVSIGLLVASRQETD